MSIQSPDPLVRQTKDVTVLLKALSHDVRFSILCHLQSGELSVGELEARLGRRQAAVSQQLARLRKDGVVATRRDGKSIRYCIASRRVSRMIDALALVFDQEGDEAARAKPGRTSDPATAA